MPSAMKARVRRPRGVRVPALGSCVARPRTVPTLVISEQRWGPRGAEGARASGMAAGSRPTSRHRWPRGPHPSRTAHTAVFPSDAPPINGISSWRPRLPLYIVPDQPGGVGRPARSHKALRPGPQTYCSPPSWHRGWATVGLRPAVASPRAPTARPHMPTARPRTPAALQRTRPASLAALPGRLASRPR